MKLKLYLIGILVLLAIAFTAQAAILPSQNQLIIPPFGGYIVATSTSANSKLMATTTPYFIGYTALNGTTTGTQYTGNIRLPAGGGLDWNNGAVTIVESASSLIFDGAANGFEFDANVGIGTNATPDSPLTIANTQISPVAPQTGTLVHLYTTGANNARVVGDVYTNATAQGFGFQGRKSRGSAAAPSRPNADDTLVFMGGNGYGTTGFPSASVGAYVVRAEASDFTNTSQPTYLAMLTAATGTISATERMRITSQGRVGIATTSPESKLDVWGTSGGKILTLFSDAGTKFMEMLNTGVTTLLGSWDFGGATSIEIVNGASPTVNVTGEIALNTSTNALSIATSTTAAELPIYPPIAFSFASTSWTGTTTDIAFPTTPNFDELITTGICYADGTGKIIVGNGTASSSLTNLSAGTTTVNVNTRFNKNGTRVIFAIGTPTTLSKVQCKFERVYLR